MAPEHAGRSLETLTVEQQEHAIGVMKVPSRALALDSMSSKRRVSLLGALPPTQRVETMAMMSFEPAEEAAVMAKLSHQERHRHLERKGIAGKALLLEKMPPPDAAACITGLSQTEATSVLLSMETKKQAKILSAMPPCQQKELFRGMSKGEKEAVLGAMGPAVRGPLVLALASHEWPGLLGALSPTEREATIAALPAASREVISNAMGREEAALSEGIEAVEGEVEDHRREVPF